LPRAWEKLCQALSKYYLALTLTCLHKRLFSIVDVCCGRPYFDDKTVKMSLSDNRIENIH